MEQKQREKLLEARAWIQKELDTCINFWLKNGMDREHGGVYWSVVTAAYLALSFLTMRWDRTWIIWPVAGVVFALLMIIYAMMR